MSVVLINGGLNGTSDMDILKSAEIYNPVTKTSCSLPKIPDQVPGRRYFSDDGGLSCGGDIADTKTNCVKWSPAFGNWTKSHTLRQKRMLHVSWATASGVYLIGGWYSPGTSEKVKLDGSVEEGFSLKYESKLLASGYFQPLWIHFKTRRSIARFDRVDNGKISQTDTQSDFLRLPVEAKN